MSKAQRTTIEAQGTAIGIQILNLSNSRGSEMRLAATTLCFGQMLMSNITQSLRNYSSLFTLHP
jgi:hypothetical protein